MSNQTKPIAATRRQFIQRAVIGGGSLALAGGATRALGAACGIVTPKQVMGPFYPTEDQLEEWTDQDWNLVRKGESVDAAKVQVLYVRGYVEGPDCKRLKGASVELWQACATGRYNHPGDAENHSELDENFQYYAEQLTDDQGRFFFKTILPGGYQADTNWFRPPHLHFKCVKKGYLDLVTQMYFEGNEFNDNDLILKKVPLAQRAEVVRKLEEVPTEPDPLLLFEDEYEKDSLVARFDLRLQKP
ncbi:MAG: hypothetical protein AAB425_16015 [Bdellovibrionota bacterium]